MFTFHKEMYGNSLIDISTEKIQPLIVRYLPASIPVDWRWMGLYLWRLNDWTVALLSRNSVHPVDWFVRDHFICRKKAPMKTNQSVFCPVKQQHSFFWKETVFIKCNFVMFGGRNLKNLDKQSYCVYKFARQRTVRAEYHNNFISKLEN